MSTSGRPDESSQMESGQKWQCSQYTGLKCPFLVTLLNTEKKFVDVDVVSTIYDSTYLSPRRFTFYIIRMSKQKHPEAASGTPGEALVRFFVHFIALIFHKFLMMIMVCVVCHKCIKCYHMSSYCIKNWDIYR